MTTQQYDIEALIAERRALAVAMDECDRDAFPGSKAWYAYSDAMRALSAFDKVHPEVIAEIRARHSASVQK